MAARALAIAQRLRPLRNETLGPFIASLARVNYAESKALYDALGDDGLDNWLARLAALTSLEIVTLLYAIAELRHHSDLDTSSLAAASTPLPDETVNTTRPPCRNCACAHDADPTRAEVRTTHEVNVCLCHKLWTGPGTKDPGQQLDLTNTPDVIAAQVRQHRLTRHRAARPPTTPTASPIRPGTTCTPSTASPEPATPGSRY